MELRLGSGLTVSDGKHLPSLPYLMDLPGKNANLLQQSPLVQDGLEIRGNFILFSGQ